MRRKIVFVSCAHTRTGTSAMMGMLKHGGLDIGGRRGKINGPNFKNPKGHFELFSLEYGFYSKYFKNHYYSSPRAPGIELVERTFIQRRHEFFKIINAEFGKCTAIALKGFGYLFTPMVYPVRDQHDFKVIQMVRPLDARVASMMRVAQKSGLAHKANKHKITKEVQSWDTLARKLVSKYHKLDYYTVNFNDLMEYPVETVKGVFSFIKESPPDDGTILDWIDPKLANRKKL